MTFSNSYAENDVKQGNEIKQRKELRNIIRIEKLEQIESKIPVVDKDTLVVLDIDYTLLQTSYPAFQMGNFPSNAEFALNIMELVSNKKSEFSTSIATSAESELIEKNAPLIIDGLHRKGARVLLLSAILTGKWGNISDIMEWRIKNLKKAGIISSDFGIKGKHKFDNFQSYRGNFPELSAGVLLTNGESVTKSEALNEFLKKIQWTPKKIIFVDDSIKNVEELCNYANKNGIHFSGFEYKGAKYGKYTAISKENFELEWNSLKDDVLSN